MIYTNSGSYRDADTQREFESAQWKSAGFPSSSSVRRWCGSSSHHGGRNVQPAVRELFQHAEQLRQSFELDQSGCHGARLGIGTGQRYETQQPGSSAEEFHRAGTAATIGAAYQNRVTHEQSDVS